MHYLLYDGSFEGLLTAIFDAYERKLMEVRIARSADQIPGLFTETTEVFTDEKKSERVWKKIVALFEKQGARTLWKAWLSEDLNVDNLLLETVRYGITTGKNILKDFGNLHVLQLQQLVKSVNREKHRMEAFVRFQLVKDDLYFAVVQPDFNVLPLILPHFQSRYADQQWMIYDSRRGFAIHYDLEKAEFVDFLPNEFFPGGNISMEALAEDEQKFQQLWSNYFKSTNIASRKNIKLHTQHVPKRYWKYLVEKTFR